jgi:dye decolorizing peroxidase
VAWQQPGFRRAYGSEAPGTTMRNLLGQLDGTKNLAPGTAAFDAAVWLGDAAGWLAGGTSLVIRRTKLHLDKWDRLDRTGREAAVGRRLGNGAPLTGTDEHDEPDFAATTPIGFPVIAEFAHIARARPSQPGEVIFRRGYNYDHGATSTELTDAGLIFTSFQADITTQFLPIQTRLAEFDLLNEWTTPIGSAVFAIPPGATEGGFVGETIL